MKYIATISGGKDSVTMCDLLLKNGYPVDYIVFNDTLLELPMMYEYIRTLKKYFKDRYGREIIVTIPDTTFEEWCFGTIRDKNAKLYGYIRGIPMVWAEPCYWRRESKVKPSAKFIKELIGDEESTFYIGFTLDESSRKMVENDQKFLYPLIDEFKMTERSCQEYLINQEMENPIYRFMTRSGCGMCPAQSDKAWYGVWKNSPDTWAYMVWVERRLEQYEEMGMKVRSKYWFKDFKTCGDMEIKFIKADQQGSLFDFSDEPLKDCFCKI